MSFCSLADHPLTAQPVAEVEARLTFSNAPKPQGMQGQESDHQWSGPYAPGFTL
jgi:hypothetical protein